MRVLLRSFLGFLLLLVACGGSPWQALPTMERSI